MTQPNQQGVCTKHLSLPSPCGCELSLDENPGITTMKQLGIMAVQVKPRPIALSISFLFESSDSCQEPELLGARDLMASSEIKAAAELTTQSKMLPLPFNG